MKLHYIGVRICCGTTSLDSETDTFSQIIKNESKPAHELCAEKDLSAYSRFTRTKYVYFLRAGGGRGRQWIISLTWRYSYGEFMTLFSKTVAERTRPGQRQDVEEQGKFACYAARPF